ncbi:TonB-dependent receptor [Novosphingobium sp. SL115]|uniref:TonB-dependent receptor n=1 Tax=Novosphingobium sp. SL115 TaxID=2995150 RepID=UPI0022731F5E|nr:TonB-dependent receptor [Novosphingobium sp. SL115]MCY1670724.1 TonB-dependent receptor [Novosphingobium sp. SL115]
MSGLPRRNVRAAAVRGLSFVALAAMGAGAVQAQEAKGEQSAIDLLNADIIVTATKKKDVENVQAVPVAITAFNAQTLQALQVRDIQSLTYSAPNVSLDQVGTSRGTANFSIRGLGVNSSIPSIDPTVGVFVDGVYIGVNNGLVFDVFDLGSIEIARGPQGILYGRNTTGGAVLINTGDPTPDWRANIRLSLDGPVDSGRGSGNISAQAVVSGPLIKDKLNFKLGGYTNYDQGYFKNLFDGKDFGEAHTQIVRGALEFLPTDGIRMVGKVEYFTSNGDGPAGQNHGLYKRDTFDFAIDNAGSYNNRTWFASHKTEIDVGDGKITNIFGFRDYDSKTNSDIDAKPVFIFHSDALFKQKQYSDELRYNNQFGALDFTAGGFWFTQKLAYDEIRYFPAFISPLAQTGGGRQDHDVLGAFASGDFAVNDALTLTAGIRWSKETKEVAVTYIRPRPACSVITATCPTTGKNPLIPTENNGFSDKRTWENWSPKLGFQYKFGSDAQIYGNWTRGFRSGGYNFRITNANAFEAVAATRGLAFDEEQVDSYELGVKFRTDDRKLTVNLAAFRTDVGDMQREINQGSAAGVAQSIYNTADAKIEGFEAEGRFAVSRNFLLTANVGYVNARYKTVKFDLTGDGVVTAADLVLDLPRTPKWTYGVGAVADFPVGEDSAITARANFQHRDKFAYTDSNYGWITAADNLDASISYRAGALTFTLYGKNLLDQVQHGGDTQLGTAAQIPVFGGPLSTGVDGAYAENPKAGTFSPLNKGRVLGVELSASF